MFSFQNDEYFIQVHLSENNKNAQLYGDSELKRILQNINEQQLIKRLNQFDDITLFLSELKTILVRHVYIYKQDKKFMSFLLCSLTSQTHCSLSIYLFFL